MADKKQKTKNLENLMKENIKLKKELIGVRKKSIAKKKPKKSKVVGLQGLQKLGGGPKI
jgi:hypothetical protein